MKEKKGALTIKDITLIGMMVAVIEVCKVASARSSGCGSLRSSVRRQLLLKARWHRYSNEEVPRAVSAALHII